MIQLAKQSLLSFIYYFGFLANEFIISPLRAQQMYNAAIDEPKVRSVS